MEQIINTVLRTTCLKLLTLGLLAPFALLAQPPVITGVLNYVRGELGLSPGTLAVITGSGIAGSNFSVTVGGRPAPVLNKQLRLIQLPAELGTGPATVVVSTSQGTSSPFNVTLDSHAPGVYALSQARPLCPIPVAPGESLSLYMVGLGATDPPVTTGSLGPAAPLAATVTKPTVTMGGLPAEVVSSVLVTWFPGIYQVTFKVPAGIRDGVQHVLVEAGGKTSNGISRAVGRSFRNLRNASAAILAYRDPAGLFTEDTAAAPESIEAAYQPCGGGLANTALSGDPRNPPTVLGGTTVKVKDAAGMERLAPILSVSPQQVNYIVPPGTANGDATVTIVSGDGITSVATLPIQRLAPSVFLMRDGGGIVAATLVRTRNGVQTAEPLVVQVDVFPQDGETVSFPITLGPESDQLTLVLAATGLRFRTSLASVKVSFWSSVDSTTLEAPVEYAGVQGEYAGVDQLNVKLPRALAAHRYWWFNFVVEDQYLSTQLFLTTTQ